MVHHDDTDKGPKEAKRPVLLRRERLADLFLPEAIVLEAEGPDLLGRKLFSKKEKKKTGQKGRGENEKQTGETKKTKKTWEEKRSEKREKDKTKKRIK